MDYCRYEQDEHQYKAVLETNHSGIDVKFIGVYDSTLDSYDYVNWFSFIPFPLQEHLLVYVMYMAAWFVFC